MGDEQLRRMREARLKRLAEKGTGSEVPRSSPAPKPRPTVHHQPAANPRPAPPRPVRRPVRTPAARPAPRPRPQTARSGAPAPGTPRFGSGEPSRLGHAAALSALLWTVLLTSGWQLPFELAAEVPVSWALPTELALREEAAPWFPDLFRYTLSSGPAADKHWLYPALAVAAAFVLRWTRSLPAALHALLGWSAALYGAAALTALGPWALRSWPVTAAVLIVSLLVLFRQPPKR
ncbi:hypothetical protein [Streptomyces sp. bgisy027]|uniref:hypothetical protein n=1 Tax=Streptomyces sp. bgisy027 TaxID=3413770 RepID=UPI003D747108